MVKVMRQLDRENSSIHEFTILAVDRGHPARTGSAKMIVNVHDADDEVATFTNNSFHFQVHENLSPGAVVGVVTAFDADEVEAFKAFDYHILDKHLYLDAGWI